MQLVRDAGKPVLPIAGDNFNGSADVYQLQDDDENVLYFADKAAASAVMQSVADCPNYECFFFENENSVLETVPDERHGSGYNVRMRTASGANTAGDVIPITLLPQGTSEESDYAGT